VLTCSRKLRFGCLEKPLSALCYHYAKVVADYPWVFIIIPIILNMIMANGYSKRVEIGDINVMFMPQNSPSIQERDAVRLFFTENSTYSATVASGPSTPSRAITEDGSIVVIVTAQDDGDMLRSEYRKVTDLYFFKLPYVFNFTMVNLLIYGTF